MQSNPDKLITSFEALPEGDITSIGEALAAYSLTGQKQGGLLTAERSQTELLRREYSTLYARLFTEKLPDLIRNSRYYSERLENLKNPYALGIINNSGSFGFSSDLVVASDPIELTFHEAMEFRKKTRLSNVAPWLVQLPVGRDLRSSGLTIWSSDEVTRSEYHSPSGKTERTYVPGFWSAFASVMNTGTREVGEASTAFRQSFVPATWIPLAEMNAFDKKN